MNTKKLNRAFKEIARKLGHNDIKIKVTAKGDNSYYDPLNERIEISASDVYEPIYKVYESLAETKIPLKHRPFLAFLHELGHHHSFVVGEFTYIQTRIERDTFDKETQEYSMLPSEQYAIQYVVHWYPKLKEEIENDYTKV